MASNALETGLIALIFNNSNLANIGDATGLRGSSAAGSFYISLHTADPGEGGSQNTNEAAYTSYARVAVARSGAGFTCSGDTASNTAAASFPQATGGSAACTHFGVGTASSGAGVLLGSAPLDSSLTVTNGITPVFAIGALKAIAT